MFSSQGALNASYKMGICRVYCSVSEVLLMAKANGIKVIFKTEGKPREAIYVIATFYSILTLEGHKFKKKTQKTSNILTKVKQKTCDQ